MIEYAINSFFAWGRDVNPRLPVRQGLTFIHGEYA